MVTKFDVGSRVYYFDYDAEEIKSELVEGIVVNEEGVFYQVKEMVFPEDRLFSCELQCKSHYQEIFL